MKTQKTAAHCHKNSKPGKSTEGTMFISFCVYYYYYLYFSSNTGTESTHIIVGGAVHRLLKYLYDTQASCLT